MKKDRSDMDWMEVCNWIPRWLLDMVKCHVDVDADDEDEEDDDVEWVSGSNDFICWQVVGSWHWQGVKWSLLELSWSCDSCNCIKSASCFKYQIVSNNLFRLAGDILGLIDFVGFSVSLNIHSKLSLLHRSHIELFRLTHFLRCVRQFSPIFQLNIIESLVFQ